MNRTPGSKKHLLSVLTRLLLAFAVAVAGMYAILTQSATAMPQAQSSATEQKPALEDRPDGRTNSLRADRAERDRCVARGGLWMNDHPAGFLRKKGCNEPTADRGKLCNDSSECESACVSDRTSPKGGRCHGYRLFFGCGKRVASGGHVAVLCID